MGKNTMLSIIIVILFIASGLVLYYGIFNTPNASLSINNNQKNIGNLLPYGEKLDFSILDERVNVSPPYIYHEVNTQQDVGVQVKDLIKNADTDNSGSSNLSF